LKRRAIIVAGGSGSRMQSEIPKQFLEIGKKPILCRTIEQFYNYDSAMQIILVLPESQFDFWERLQVIYNFTIPHILVKGGETRFHSVKNAIDSIVSEEECVIAIHDGVRPFVNSTIIHNSFMTAEQLGNALTVVQLKDSIRKINVSDSQSLDRKEYVLVQTPQCFLLSILKKAFLQPYQDNFTDDASVVQNLGIKIHLVEGDYKNIKITSPEDMWVAKSILQNLKNDGIN